MLPSPTAPRSRHAVGWPREVGILHNGNRQRVPSEYAYYSNVISSGRRAEYNFFHPRTFSGNSHSQLRTGNAPSPGRSGPLPRRRSKMAVRIGDEAPDFTAETTEGKIRFHEWIGDKWAILFSHPKDFTPVCTTELGYMAKLKPEFDRRNTKIIGLSIDPVSDHKNWVKDIQETQGTAVNYPMIGDADLNVAKLYDMIHPNASGGKRTAADNATIRSVFIIGPDRKSTRLNSSHSQISYAVFCLKKKKKKSIAKQNSDTEW